MNKQRPRLLAWALWGFYLVLGLLSLLLQAIWSVTPLCQFAILWLLLFPWSTIGAFVASRDPTNAIGWIFLAAPILHVLGPIGEEYALYALVTRPGSLPGGEWIAWGGNWADDIGFSLLLMFMFLIFPNGRLLSPRWRPVAWFTAGFVALNTLRAALQPGPLQLEPGFPSITNPAGVERLAGVLQGAERLQELLNPMVVGACIFSVVLRAIRATREERQQLKWLAYAAGLFFGWALLAFLNSILGFPVPGSVVVGVFICAVTVLPLAVGIAILRRLYAIDVLINRTLVYGALSGTLVAVYLGSVVSAQRLAQTVTGNTATELATVISTLAVAALFHPLRRYIQSFIDRRFYRRKYDAQKTLQIYSTYLRDETDLQRLTEETLAVVEETLQPAYVFLWLRESRQESPRG